MIVNIKVDQNYRGVPELRITAVLNSRFLNLTLREAEEIIAELQHAAGTLRYGIANPGRCEMDNGTAQGHVGQFADHFGHVRLYRWANVTREQGFAWLCETCRKHEHGQDVGTPWEGLALMPVT